MKPGTMILRLISRLEAGETLCLRRFQSDTGEGVEWWFEPSGKKAPPRTVERALGQGVIVPNHDGLFGDSQTFVLSDQ